MKSRDKIVEAIRLQIKEGVDAIKVSGSSDSAVFEDPLEGTAFAPEEFALIASETHWLNRVCTVHARSRDSLLYASQVRFDWLMHASCIDDRGIELCLKHGIAITLAPTLLLNIVASSASQRVGASALDVFKAEIDAAAENLGRAYRAGVKLMAGSETGWSLVPYGQWHARELQALVELVGLTPLQAIHAGTLAGTSCLPRWRNSIGRLEAGRLADLIVLDGDPTREIRVLQHPERCNIVMKGGTIVDTTAPIPNRRVWPYERYKTYLAGPILPGATRSTRPPARGSSRPELELAMTAIVYPLSVAGRLTRVIESGHGEHSVLFIHGLGARADRWRGTVERFGGNRYRAVAFDLPGHGFAAKGADIPATVPALARYALALLDELEIGRLTLVGTSLGAHIAAYIATLIPERVRGLVMVGALGLVPIGRETGETIRQNVVAVSRERIAGKLRYVLADPAMATVEMAEEEFRINNSPGAIDSLGALGAYIATSVDDDCVGPTLKDMIGSEKMMLVWGEQDKVVPLSIAHSALALLGSPELVVVPAAGHVPYLERPEIFDPALLRFMSRPGG